MILGMRKRPHLIHTLFLAVICLPHHKTGKFTNIFHLIVKSLSFQEIYTYWIKQPPYRIGVIVHVDPVANEVVVAPSGQVNLTRRIGIFCLNY